VVGEETDVVENRRVGSLWHLPRSWQIARAHARGCGLKKKSGAPFDKTPLRTLNGILAFDIMFDDATGHLDLWDGREFSTEYKSTGDWWTRATRISLWPARAD
jgi:hypothetical protein